MLITAFLEGLILLNVNKTAHTNTYYLSRPQTVNGLKVFISFIRMEQLPCFPLVAASKPRMGF